MTKHFSEADLLETYYTQPGESMPVMMHLASCAECAGRYGRLETKLRGLAECHVERPETFWARQRISVMRRIGQQREKQRVWARASRVAAAATLAFLLGGVVVYKSVEPALQPAPAVIARGSTVSPGAQAAENTIPADPWQSEELQDFQSVVAWESWIDEAKPTPGDTSL